MGVPEDASLFAGDMYDMLAQLREHSPVLHIPDQDVYVVTHYDDVITVIRDHQRFSSKFDDLMQDVPETLRDRLPEGFLLLVPTLVSNDPPGHTRIRKLAQKALTPRKVAGHEPDIVNICNRFIDEFDADSGRVEIMCALATPLPTQVLCSLLGIAWDDRRQFEVWARGAVELITPSIPEERRLELAKEQADFRDYVFGVVDERTSRPGADLISGLILAREEGEPALTRLEISSIVTQFMTAGVDTTTSGMGNVLVMLLHHPDLMDRAIAEPAIISTIIEEALRRLAPARGALRKAMCDVELSGTLIPKGARVFGLIASANHDDSRFHCPHRYDVDRESSELKRALTFGQGAHFCLGAPLARLEIRVAITQLLARLGRLRLAESFEIPWSESLMFQGPLKLELAWDRSRTAPRSAARTPSR